MASAGEGLLALWELWRARPICFRLLTHWARPAAPRAAWTAGRSRATATPEAAGDETLGNESREVRETPCALDTIVSEPGESRALNWSGLGTLAGSMRRNGPAGAAPRAAARALPIM